VRIAAFSESEVSRGLLLSWSGRTIVLILGADNGTEIFILL